MTVEDPIEYYIDGIGQTQVNTKVEMTFARGLRAILRQDPDVVMVGEIRDLETAQIAVQASLTGHLVLSTLHTNTAVGAVTRLRDMGVEPFLLVLEPDRRARAAPGARAEPGHRARRTRPASTSGGCSTCRTTRRRRRCIGPARDAGSGYRGRTGIYELVIVDDHMRTMIHDGAGEHELERYARTHDALGIRDDGRAKVLARRDHARGSPARHARGLSAVGPWAPSNTPRSTPRGRERKGVLEGDTARHVRQLLREQQLLPVTVTEVSRREADARVAQFSLGAAASPPPISRC